MASQVAANAALITEQHALLSRTRGGRITVQAGFAVIGLASVARVAAVGCFLVVEFFIVVELVVIGVPALISGFHIARLFACF